MKLGDAIKRLQEFEELGFSDIEMISLVDVDGKFMLDWNRTFELIEIPIDEDSGEPSMKLVCAFMEPFEDVRTELSLVQTETKRGNNE